MRGMSRRARAGRGVWLWSVVLGAFCLLAAIPAPSGASGSCSSPFTTPGESTCVVPSDAVGVTITAVGGAGASGGGVGDRVQATFPVGPGDPVKPGETLFVEVGGNGSGTTGGANGGANGGSGDFGGPDGGGGGGASDVRACSASSCALTSNDTRLVVAAGGGGGGGGGAAGGNAGAQGSAGSSSRDGAGGLPGTSSAPGSGGKAGCTPCSSDAASGSLARGGDGGPGMDACGDPLCDAGGGGGGGGGYFGGGGGGGGFGTSAFGAGGGGGGGGDFLSSSATSPSSSPNTAAAAPSVTVSFKFPAAPSISIAKPGKGAKYTRGQMIDSSFTCTEGASGPGIASCLDQNAHPSGHRIDTSTTGRHAFKVTAISKDGQRATATVTYTVQEPTPRLTALKIAPRHFLAATKGPTVGGNSDTGATIRYGDTLAGHALLVVLRCAGKHHRCTRLARVGSFAHRDHAGANRLHFTGRLHHRALRPGRYRLRVTAVLNGKRSNTVTIAFSVLPPPAVCQDRDHDGDCDTPGGI